MDLRAAWYLARKDLEYMLRIRETLLWTFLMPIVFFFFIGTVTGGFSSGGGGDSKDPLVMDVDPGAGVLAGQLERRLEAVGFELRTPDPEAEPGRWPRLVLPAGFTDSLLAGHTQKLQLHQGQTGLGGDYNEFRVTRAAMSLLADIVAATETGNAPTSEAITMMSQAPDRLTLSVRQAGFRRTIPSGYDQSVPGTMVMFTILVLLTSGSVLILVERKEGLLRRLASTPHSRATIILGKWGGRLMLGLIQIGFAMLVGRLVFRVDWGPHLLTLLAVMLVYAGLVAMLGLLLGSLARTEGQATGIGVLAANLLGALGGCWWPIEITPEWMQKLALALPTGWTMDALHQLVNFGAPPQTVLPHLAVLAVGTLVAGWFTTRAFRFL